MPEPVIVAPRPASPAYRLGRATLVPLAVLLFRPRVRGREHVPRTGPVIFASNHLSFIDSIVIPVLSPRPVRFLAKSSYFDGTGLRGRLGAWFFRSIGAVPVERGAGNAAQVALDAGKGILDSGDAFALYPEGTRSLDGRLYRGRTGVAWLALATGAVVVPVGLVGTERLLPVGSSRPRLRRIDVVFGEALDLSPFGAATSGRARRQATDAVMAAIAGLSGQEEANAYNEAPPRSAGERVGRVLRRERL